MFASATLNSSGTKWAVSAAALGFSLALAAPGAAQTVVNPGFETGDASGWTLSGGTWTDVSVWPPVDSTWAGAPNSVTITNAGDFDPFTSAPTVFAGNHAIRLNDANPNYGVTALAQTVNGYAGNKLYYAWNAVLEPSHGPTDSPSFIIKVVDKTTGKVINNIAYSAYTAQNTTIFRTAGRYVTSDWKVEDIDMIAGHDYDLLFVALDCPYGAHSGYVYVDGFGDIIPAANANVGFDPATDITRGAEVLIPIPGGGAVVPDIDLAKAFYTTTELNDGDVNPNFVGGTLQFASAGDVSTALTVQTQGGTIDTNGLDVGLSGGLTGPGGMIKTGEGTLTLSGAISTINETFAVQQGTLAVNSALSSLDVTVASGATLKGTGTIVADVAVGAAGRLAPGNSPGTLVVAAGDVTFDDAARFEVEIDGRTYNPAGGAGTYDRLALSSGATFQPNGILAPTLRGITGGNNTYTPAVGDTFTVVEGGAVGSGAFDSVVQPATGLAANTRFDVIYRPTSVTIATTPGSFASYGASAGWKVNAVSAAEGLDPFRPAAGARAGAFFPLFDGLYGMDGGDLGYAFSQISGEIHANTMQMAQASAQDVSRIALGAAQEPWGCPPEVQTPGEFTEPPPEGAADGCGITSASKGATVWGRYLGQSTDVGEDDIAYGYGRSAKGLIAGVSVVNVDGTRLGVGGSYSNGDMNSDVSSSAEIDTASVFAYGAHRFGSITIGGVIGWNQADVDTVSNVSLTTGNLQATDGYKIETWTGALDARLDVPVGARSVFRPVVGMEFAKTSSDGVAETGPATIALVLPKEKWTSVRTKLGGEFAVGVGNPVEFGLFANWYHELNDTTAVRTAQLGAANWVVSSVDADKDTIEGGALLGLKLNNAIKFRFEYAILRNGEYHTDRASAGVAIKF
ncbi:autotransporter outer membrane beta-barrel domain-containing protein [Novosphingobium sp. AP12]|uniref:autotransporter family protein n=1 Tax=Novosphingobium sp. AP12 TaxID=1144305 RepID=UPI000271D8E0|nr:autotransporter outer membrane beta-barrel domain-containing protein [Novosphingobium sp. AP12]EJL27461.1 putative autotransporter protein [Novosphingobium sp. AP12]